MSGQSTLNSSAFIEAQQYSQFILQNLYDGLLPGNFYRNVSDFPAGSTLNIKTIGTASIQEVTEDSPVTYSAIESGTVTLQITDYVGDAWYITDVLRQDAAQIEALQAARAFASTRAMQEHWETRFLATANAAQTANDPNTINGFAHRKAASGANGQVLEADFIDMRLSFDKANVPMGGRIAIVDPVVAATFSKTALTTNLNNFQELSYYEDLVSNGFDRDHQFVMLWHGWAVFTSNRLPRITVAESSIGSGNANSYGVGAIANIFMSIADDQTKPIMCAWRSMPKVEGERNKDRARDEFVTRARYGMGAQRVDTLGILLCNPTATA